MLDIKKLKNEIKTEIQNNIFVKTTVGQQLIDSLQLKNFKYSWIMKIQDSALPIFVIIVDSRRPDTYLSLSKIKKLDSTILKRTQQYGKNKLLAKNIKFTVPIPLQYFNQKIQSNAIIIRYDIAGYYFMDRPMYEKVLNNIEVW